jgi:hypothetical protein
MKIAEKEVYSHKPFNESWSAVKEWNTSSNGLNLHNRSSEPI